MSIQILAAVLAGNLVKRASDAPGVIQLPGPSAPNTNTGLITQPSRQLHIPTRETSPDAPAGRIAQVRAMIARRPGLAAILAGLATAAGGTAAVIGSRSAGDAPAPAPAPVDAPPPVVPPAAAPKSWLEDKTGYKLTGDNTLDAVAGGAATLAAAGGIYGLYKLLSKKKQPAYEVE